MNKQLLTAVLFTVPFYAAAYDYDKLPQQPAGKETPITYEQAYPDLTQKSHIEIEDITTKLDRLAKQAKYKRQQAQAAEAEQDETVTYSATEDIDRKLDQAAQHKEGNKPSQAQTRQVWSPVPGGHGGHDWVAVPVQPAEEPARQAGSEAPATGVDNGAAAPQQSSDGHRNEVWSADPATGAHD